MKWRVDQCIGAYSSAMSDMYFSYLYFSLANALFFGLSFDLTLGPGALASTATLSLPAKLGHPGDSFGSTTSSISIVHILLR